MLHNNAKQRRLKSSAPTRAVAFCFAKQGGFMLPLTIKDLKQFMNKLLISDTFDGMCLSEAYICTGCSLYNRWKAQHPLLP